MIFAVNASLCVFPLLLIVFVAVISRLCFFFFFFSVCVCGRDD